MLSDGSNVYDDEFEFWAGYLAGFDLIRAEKILKTYTRSTIARAAISKMKFTDA